MPGEATEGGLHANPLRRYCGAMPSDHKPHHSPDEEREIREAALDETIAASFPASDPPSTIPNPEDETALERKYEHRDDAGAPNS